MSDTAESTQKRIPRRWAVLLIAIGMMLAVASGIGLFLFPAAPEAVTAEATTSPTVSIPALIVTLANQPLVQRQIVQPPTREILPTATFSPTALPSTSTLQPTNTTPPTQAPDTASQPTPQGTPIAFTTEERNALSWMCYYEVGGMGTVKYDACLSVISTVRARYVYDSGMGTD